ncbi:hypothetical protein ABT56_00430 [Photobacterium aquae]|uniref:DUF4019 domain-containing protein n=1 Tax=Photobacterium aquae TaxID=1195763 RepID=A0A0J1HD86_9GAMM|nr:DUF4019 domain-containing protein [Photobacterium aquae]KLV09588.1 hypothetical protein ABT56_00430 [Photobacterium aquae]
MLRKLFFTLLLIPSISYANSNSAEAEVADWIALIDTKQYEMSWEDSAEYFQAQVSKTDWVATVSAVRKSAGELKSRTLIASQFADDLPNAPKGEYVIFQYQSVFSKADEVIETITLIKSGNEWRAIGYFVK